MQIQISEDLYNQLDDSNKINFIRIQSSLNFETDILEIRKKLKVPPKGYQDQIDDNFGFGIEEQYFIFSTKNNGSVDASKFEHYQKAKAKLLKLVTKESLSVIDRYGLPTSWVDTLIQIIFYNIFALPSRYRLVYDGYQKHYAITFESLTTPNDICDWIRKNWEWQFKPITEAETSKSIKINNMPRFENLDEIIEIIDFRDNQKKTFVEIAKLLLARQKLDNDDSVLDSEIKRIENNYYGIKKAFGKVSKKV